MRVVPVDFVPVAPHTEAVYRVVTDERSVFVKVLRSPALWPMLDEMPDEVRTALLTAFPWRDEAEFLMSGFDLPPGMRTPEVVRIDDRGDRVELWLEDIEVADVVWDLPRFERAARLLGRWSGRTFGGTPGGALRFLARGALELEALGPVAPELRPLAARVPQLLDRLDELPQTGGHGDACPQNLLVPREDPESFVVIDVTWQRPQPVGSDLGQLLVGLAHDGTLAVSDLPPIREAIIDAYAAGLAEEGHHVQRDDVAFGCDASMVVRSAFHSRPELTGYLAGVV